MAPRTRPWTEKQVRAWWSEWPDANITGAGGKHILYSMPDFPVQNSAGKIGHGIDVRGRGGYIVASPSIHPDSRRAYLWDGADPLEQQTIAQAPAWLLEKIKAAAEDKAAKVPAAQIPEGERNTTLFKVASRWRRMGHSVEEIMAILRPVNQKRCHPPLSDSELRTIAESAGRYVPNAKANLFAISGEPAMEAEHGGDRGGEHNQTNVHDLACAITADHHFARDVGGRLYIFKNGVYRPGGELFVQQRVKALMNTWGLAEKWSIHKAAEVVEYIRVDCSELWTDPPADTINVANGLLDVKERRRRPHDPAFLSAVQLPVAFDPEAHCPAWDTFVEEVFPTDSEAIAWEIPAWLMTPDTSIQKALLLLGEGSNGKSTYLRACIAFVGKQNTAALSLHRLEQDKFAAARLVGRLANICPDLPTAHLSSTSMFKALTGGDVVPAEYKFRDSFEYVPYAKLLFSANKPPRTDDDTHGFFRRWQVVPFARCFEEGAKGTLSRQELDARLCSPTELSGVLNKALVALAVIRKQNGFTKSDSMEQAWDEFRETTDPLSVWLDNSTVERPNVYISAAALRAAYNRHLAAAGKQGVMKTAFGLQFKRLKPKIDSRQLTYMDKAHVWCYVGIGLKGETQEFSPETEEFDF